MKLIVTGATGTAGSEVIRQALKDDTVTAVTAICRRQPDIAHPKLTTVIHKDFLDYTGLDSIFKSHDACIWCLGVSSQQVNEEQYEVITHMYTIKAAQAMLHANPGIDFIFLSGEGADVLEKSRQIFARIKGKTENDLSKLSFGSLHMARAGAIWPLHDNPGQHFLYKLFRPLLPVIDLLSPSGVIRADVLARAMINLAKNGHTQRVVENEDLKKLGAE